MNTERGVIPSVIGIDLKLAMAAKAAYAGKEAVRKIFQAKECIELKDEETGTEGYAAITDDCVFVIFRGTQEKTDILTDLLSFKTCDGHYRLHWGFFRAYSSIHEKVIDALSKHPTKHVYFAGHSLGGALAAIGSLLTPTPYKTLVTFGQPRAGNSNVAKDLEDIEYRRYVNRADIVARIPRINYFHGGECFYLTSEENLVINPSDWYKFKDRFPYSKERLTDHSIDEYIRKLKKLNGE